MKPSKVAKQENQPTFPAWFVTVLWLLRIFGELKWLKDLKNFILNLVVQISELFVIAALVLSMVNFLTGGALMEKVPWLNDSWAWLQAIAIDAGFGVVLVSFFDNFKKDTFVQCILYFILTVLLGFNAGAVTYIDSLASASHLAMTDPGVNPFPLWILSLTRAIAVVGFLGVSRIHSYDFTKIDVSALISLVREDVTKSVVSAQPTNVQEVTTPTNTIVALPEPKAEGENVTIPDLTEEVTNGINKILGLNGEGDDNVTTIVTPGFVEKKVTKTNRRIVEIVGKDDVGDKIKAAIKRLENRGDKVTDTTIAAEAGFKNRITVLRWRKRQGDQEDEQVS